MLSVGWQAGVEVQVCFHAFPRTVLAEIVSFFLIEKIDVIKQKTNRNSVDKESTQQGCNRNSNEKQQEPKPLTELLKREIKSILNCCCSPIPQNTKPKELTKISLS
jgi:hypothetical protein